MHVPWIERHILNHWTTRGVPYCVFLSEVFSKQIINLQVKFLFFFKFKLNKCQTSYHYLHLYLFFLSVYLTFYF